MMKKFIILLLIGGFGYAQTVLWTGNNVQRTERAYMVGAHTGIIAFPAVSYWRGNRAGYKAVANNIYAGVSYNFSDNLGMSVMIPYYIDDYKTPVERQSRGPGDVIFDLKFSTGIGKSFYLGFVPIVTLPLGAQREHGIDSTTSRVITKGGLFRDFTSNFYDYGAILALSRKGRLFNVHLNLGGVNNYQLPFEGSDYNVGIVGLAIERKGLVLSPFIEFWDGRYMSQDGVGSGPIFVSIGTPVQLGRRLKLKFGFDYPLYTRDTLGARPPVLNPAYTGFKGPFPDFAPDFVVNASCELKFFVKASKALGKVVIIAKDEKTKAPIEGALVRIGDYTGTTDKNGVYETDYIGEGVYHVHIQSPEYEKVSDFVSVQRGKKLKYIMYLSDKYQSLVIKVKDAATLNPINGAVLFPELGMHRYAIDTTGVLNLKVKRGFYSLYIWSKNHAGQSLTIDSPKRDTIIMNVFLTPFKGGSEYILPVVYFDFDRYNLKREYIPLLDQLGKYLVENKDYKLRITGYASSEGKTDYNFKLGLKRAESVKSYLVKRYNIDASRLTTDSEGEANPALPNSTHFNRQINRRVEFTLVK